MVISIVLVLIVAVWDSRNRLRKESMGPGSEKCAFKSPQEWCMILVLVRLRQED